ncbi:hypothetical protein KBK19_19000 [Microvirga sp. STR05]|uniref:STAS/SEC14 domain-containing protein n=1 Tax=Hymenobacter duratus TaxID=2771356 RepID=A0ABR8JJU6_9BACT|nr:hypothetical protein [Hymenobacter duratus]MBD2717139.1 hypothetical protein [Hymenobacter duratus]MBR7952055.1 hypothetical protein [Microvirga sp. STR05]
MPAPAAEFLLLSYRADLHVLVGRWMRVVTLAEMQQGYELLLQAAVEHRCRQWLLDTRRRNNTDEEGAQWMTQEFLPRLQGLLGGTTALAYLLPPVHLRNAAADAAFPPASYFKDKPFISDRFIDERLAIEWLQLQQSLAPAS